MPDDTLTLREHLEAIRDRTAPYKGQRQREILTHADAVAALDLLNNARRAPLSYANRLVFDPERSE